MWQRSKYYSYSKELNILIYGPRMYFYAWATAGMGKEGRHLSPGNAVKCFCAFVVTVG